MALVRALSVSLLLLAASPAAGEGVTPGAAEAPAGPEPAAQAVRPGAEAPLRAAARAGPAGALVAALSYPGLGQLVVGSETKAAVVGAAQALLVGRLVLEDRWTRHALRLYNETGQRSYYEEYSDHYDRRQTLVWWVVAVALLSVADAYVDAHLAGFDAPAPPALLDVMEDAPGVAPGSLRLGIEFPF